MVDAVAVENLVKRWSGLWGPSTQALAGVSLRIPQGASFGLIGPNGAGKTTFIKLLLGIARPTSGSVKVLGGDPEDPAVRAFIGYLPERLHLPAALRANDFLTSVATLKSVALNRQQVTKLLERVGLENSTQRIGTYSKGMRQRLGLAAAMVGQPKLYVLDEPTDGIDPVGRMEVRALLLEERRRGATILFNSHLLGETERLCDSVGILDKGRLRLVGSLEDVRRASGRWRVAFAAPANADLLEAAGFEREGGGWSFMSGDVAALNQAIDEARRGGAQLVELAPARRDLEQVVAQALDVELGGEGSGGGNENGSGSGGRP